MDHWGYDYCYQFVAQLDQAHSEGTGWGALGFSFGMFMNYVVGLRAVVVIRIRESLYIPNTVHKRAKLSPEEYEPLIQALQYPCYAHSNLLAAAEVGHENPVDIVAWEIAVSNHPHKLLTYTSSPRSPAHAHRTPSSKSTFGEKSPDSLVYSRRSNC